MSAFARRHLDLVLRTTGEAVAHCIGRGPRWDDHAAELAAEGLRAARVLGLYDSRMDSRTVAPAAEVVGGSPAITGRQEAA